jgi:outer membrane protein assembly factor BamA
MILNRLTLALAAVFAMQPALAEAPFVVKDIRVEGIQRRRERCWLPVQVGDVMTDSDGGDQGALRHRIFQGRQAGSARRRGDHHG